MMATKRSNADITDDEPRVFASGTIEDRQSTFIAHYSPTASAKTLQSSPEFASASHRIAAWRKASTQRTLSATKQIFSSGSDDDGEKYAGKRLELVLNDLQVQGAIVVARWYGGVLLGPIRFTHIENVAKEAVAAWKESTGETSAKKQKVEPTPVDEVAERKRLTKQLTDRDQSIVVLRQLLAEKQAPAEGKGKEASQPSSSPAQPINYGEMPILRLRQLDKARDATIAWILKQIDQAEAKDPGSQASTKSVVAASGTDAKGTS